MSTIIPLTMSRTTSRRANPPTPPCARRRDVGRHATPSRMLRSATCATCATSSLYEGRFRVPCPPSPASRAVLTAREAGRGPKTTVTNGDGRDEPLLRGPLVRDVEASDSAATKNARTSQRDEARSASSDGKRFRRRQDDHHEREEDEPEGLVSFREARWPSVLALWTGCAPHGRAIGCSDDVAVIRGYVEASGGVAKVWATAVIPFGQVLRVFCSRVRTARVLVAILAAMSIARRLRSVSFRIER
jgi:hypothetical protein